MKLKITMIVDDHEIDTVKPFTIDMAKEAYREDVLNLRQQGYDIDVLSIEIEEVK